MSASGGAAAGRTAGSSPWRDAYYQRVRPVVGRTLVGRTLAVYDAAETGGIALALLHTGLLRVRAAASPLGPETAFATAYPEATGLGAAQALDLLARDHNRFEDGFEIVETGDPTRGADLVVGASREALAAALAAGLPAVILRRFGGERPVGGVLLCHLPGGGASPEALLAAAERVGLAADAAAAARAAGMADLDTYLDWLDLCDPALALCKWLLCRGDPSVPARPDLEARLVERGACLIARGRPDWPFWVSFADPARPGALASLLEARTRRYAPPPTALAGARLLVIGCGTASLMLAEAPRLFPVIVACDAKPFSVQNPVRQAISTEGIGLPKPLALRRLLAHRLDHAGTELRTSPDAALLGNPTPPPGWSGDDAYGRPETVVSWWRRDGVALGAAELFLRAADEGSLARFEQLLDEVQPTVTVVAMGRSRDDNFVACEILRRRGLRHVVPTALPGVSHYKHIAVDGHEGPCYDCLQGHLAIDGGQGPTLTDAERELYYGGTQPATLAETLPSAHSLLRLTRELALPRPLRGAWLLEQLARERTCFVGANRVEPAAGASGDDAAAAAGGWLYGTADPFQVVTFGIDDIVGSRAGEVCSCGRENRPAGAA